MSLHLQITTTSGKVLEVEAEDDWSVRCLKCAIQRLSGHHPSRQRLVSSKGVQLVDEEQLSRCPGVSQLILVVHPKSNAELKRLKKWAEVTPQWLQRGCDEILENAGLELGKARGSVHQEGNVIDSHKEVIAAMRKGPHQLVQIGREVELQYTSADRRRATLDAVLLAVEREPRLLLPYVDYDLALKVVQSLPGTFDHLPETLQKSPYILYSALEHDDKVRTEFLQSAGKREIREWQWHMQDEAKPLRKRRAAKYG